MKLFSALIVAAFCASSTGCANGPEANENAALVKEDRCAVKGSNLPRRDCRTLVDVVSGDAMDRPTAGPTSRSSGTPR